MIDIRRLVKILTAGDDDAALARKARDLRASGGWVFAAIAAGIEEYRDRRVLGVREAA